VKTPIVRDNLGDVFAINLLLVFTAHVVLHDKDDGVLNILLIGLDDLELLHEKLA
jgi:hypothetical protein